MLLNFLPYSRRQHAKKPTKGTGFHSFMYSLIQHGFIEHRPTEAVLLSTGDGEAISRPNFSLTHQEGRNAIVLFWNSIHRWKMIFPLNLSELMALSSAQEEPPGLTPVLRPPSAASQEGKSARGGGGGRARWVYKVTWSISCSFWIALCWNSEGICVELKMRLSLASGTMLIKLIISRRNT